MAKIVREATFKALAKYTHKPRGLSAEAKYAISFESDLDKYTDDEIIYLDKR